MAVPLTILNPRECPSTQTGGRKIITFDRENVPDILSVWLRKTLQRCTDTGLTFEWGPVLLVIFPSPKLPSPLLQVCCMRSKPPGTRQREFFLDAFFWRNAEIIYEVTGVWENFLL